MNTATRSPDQRPSYTHRLCVAPMMDWTDRHCRYFHRLLAPSALLYTEMVTTGAVLHGDQERLLGFSEEEHPVALQLGGSDPDDLASSAKIAEQRGYDEVNLNVGCPSDRVQRGRFGACLMLEPELVRDCVAAMRENVDIPVTVKTRIGVDDQDSYDYFRDFIGMVADSGCDTFIIHARKAWLSGLSPKQNREIPELKYDRVYRLKQDYPHLNIVLNGGVTTVGQALAQLELLDGVMLGRAAYQTPWVLAECQEALFPDAGVAGREDAVRCMTKYLEKAIDAGIPVKHISRHMLGLFQGMPGARSWRRYISENAHLDTQNRMLLMQALDAMRTVNQRVPDPSRAGSVSVHADAIE